MLTNVVYSQKLHKPQIFEINDCRDAYRGEMSRTLLYKDINFLCSVSLHMHQSHMLLLALSSPRLDPVLAKLGGPGRGRLVLGTHALSRGIAIHSLFDQHALAV